MLTDIFRQTVKPLQPEHIRDLERIHEAIVWNQEQHHLHMQTVHELEQNQNALSRAQRRFRTIDKDEHVAHRLLCQTLSLQHEPELQRATLLVDMHETIIQVLTDDLERFLEANYNIKREQGWHLDLQQRVLYKRPVLKKTKQDTDDLVAVAMPEKESEPTASEEVETP